MKKKCSSKNDLGHYVLRIWSQKSHYLIQSFNKHTITPTAHTKKMTHTCFIADYYERPATTWIRNTRITQSKENNEQKMTGNKANPQNKPYILTGE